MEGGRAGSIRETVARANGSDGSSDQEAIASAQRSAHRMIRRSPSTTLAGSTAVVGFFLALAGCEDGRSRESLRPVVRSAVRCTVETSWTPAVDGKIESARTLGLSWRVEAEDEGVWRNDDLQDPVVSPSIAVQAIGWNTALHECILSPYAVRVIKMTLLTPSDAHRSPPNF